MARCDWRVSFEVTAGLMEVHLNTTAESSEKDRAGIRPGRTEREMLSSKEVESTGTEDTFLLASHPPTEQKQKKRCDPVLHQE